MSTSQSFLASWPGAIEFFTWLVFSSVKGSLAACGILLLRSIWKKRLGAQARYLLWIAACASFLLPIGWTVHWPASEPMDGAVAERRLDGPLRAPAVPAEGAADTGMMHDKEATLTTLEISPPIATTNQASAEIRKDMFGVSLVDTLTLLWLAGLLVLVAGVVRNHARYRRIKLLARAVEPRYRMLFHESSRELGLTRKVHIAQSSQIRTPVLYGIWTPTLLLPLQFAAKCEPRMLRHVFLHELAHVKRLDIAATWIVALIHVLHWFNPIVWYAARKFRVDMEAACDAHVLQSLAAGERQEYGHTLINVSSWPEEIELIPQGVGIVETFRQLKARIEMINQFKARGPVQWVSLCISLAALSPLALAQLAIEQPANKLTEQTSAAGRTSADKPVSLSTKSDNESRASVATTAASQPSRQLVPPTNATSSPKVASVGTATRVAYFKINYVKATDVQALVQQGSGLSLLSNRGHLAVDSRTNTLLVNDTDERLAAIRELVANVDVPLQQVMIDARIVIVDKAVSKELLAKAQADRDANNVTRPHTPNIVRMNPHYNVEIELAALESARKGELVATARVITANRKEATIKQGIVFPAAKRGGNSAGSPAIITVKSRPVISPDNRIHFNVVLSREGGGKGNSANESSQSTHDSLHFGTALLMDDGQTMVLSGLLNAQKPTAGEEPEADVPALDTEVLIFLTPHIVLEEAGRDL